jgi:hypothetical protein
MTTVPIQAHRETGFISASRFTLCGNSGFNTGRTVFSALSIDSSFQQKAEKGLTA